MGVIATWRAVSAYVQSLSVACQVRRSELGWTAYGKQSGCCPFSGRRFGTLTLLISTCFALAEDSALGVFLWATDSTINRRVPWPDQNES